MRFATFDDVVTHGGQGIGVTDWITVDQELIDRFADTVGDRQWIHVDPARAGEEAELGTTVAHGALTLSLCTTFVAELLHVDDAASAVHAGYERVRFLCPVPSGSRLRGRAQLGTPKRLRGRLQTPVEVRAEVAAPSADPSSAPAVACRATQLVVLYPFPPRSA